MKPEFLPILRFDLGPHAGLLYVTRPENGAKARASGYTRNVHGWGAEIHLLYLIRKRLEQAKIIVAKKTMSKDARFGHLMGDDYMPYLRTRIQDEKTQPNIWIVDLNYAIRSSAEDYNAGKIVTLSVQGDIFQEEGQDALQPDWAERLQHLCTNGDIVCEVKTPERILTS